MVEHQPNGRAFRVLVVDDNVEIAGLVASILESEGDFEASVRNEPDAAIAAARETPFDVVVSDVVMPGKDGLDLIRAVRAFDLDVPIILLTGTPSLSVSQRAVELGAFRYLFKPVDHAALLDAARQAAFAHQIARLKRRAFELSGVPDLVPGDVAGMSDALDAALESMHLVFQPIVEATGGALYGYEALLRTTSKRLPGPAEMLEVAERLDRLEELGRAVRAHAADALRDMPEGSRLFLNLHPRELTDARLGEPEEPLTAFGERVVLEITERACLDRIPEVERKVKTMRKRGFEIAVDDLGAGYAGLSSFAMLRPGIVKLDRSLVSGIDGSAIKQSLVGSFVRSCHDLGVRVVAESIETEAERATCTELGCDLLQGYLLGRPGPLPSA